MPRFGGGLVEVPGQVDFAALADRRGLLGGIPNDKIRRRHTPTSVGIWLVGVDSDFFNPVADNGTIFWSEDGFYWGATVTNLSGGVKGISYANGFFVAGGTYFGDNALT